MRVAIISDTHWGVQGDSPVYQSALSRFFEETFFPKLKNENITHVIHLGDVFHRRKSINTLTLHHFHKDFMQPLKEMGATLDIIIGNHDCYYTDTNAVNSVQGVLAGFENVKTFIDPTVHTIDGPDCEYPCVYLPWVVPQNLQRTIDTIKRAKKEKIPFVFGHLEIDGTYNGRGRPYEGGFDRNIFRGFEKVFSGHIHHRSVTKNVIYVGPPVEQDWGEYGEPHGFVILDLDTGDHKFIDNPHFLYQIIEYSGQKKADFHVEGQYVKLVVLEKPNEKTFNKFVEQLSNNNPAKLDIVDKEVLEIIEPGGDENANSQYTDTREVILSFVDEQIEGDVKDKEILKDILTDSYDAVTK